MPFSSHIKIKVCGMRDYENIGEVSALHPDYMGFIFYPGSKRAVGDEFVMPDNFPDSTKRIGVFVNEEASSIARLVERHGLDFVQLHGEETVQQCEMIRDSGVKVIKAMSIDDNFSFDGILPYKRSVDYFLFDTKGFERGGTGLSFNWKILEKYDQDIPFFLSGGLSPNNIKNVAKLKGMNIHAVDLNSGVERAPGVKDVKLIERIQMTLMNSHWLEY